MLRNTKPKLIGLFIFVVGVVGSGYNWYSVLTQGVYWQKPSFLFPFFACFGLSILIYPMSKSERLAKYGADQIPWKNIPTGQKLLILLGVVLGVSQLAPFSGHMSI